MSRDARPPEAPGTEERAVATIAEELGRFSASLSYEAIPPPVVEKAKELVLDTVGIAAGSSALPFGRAALVLVAGWGGAPDSSLIGSPVKVPAHHAALANGILAHGQDYDDTHTESVVHPSACLVPVALALGERAGASGRETLTALVGGLEVMIRLGLPALNRFHLHGFHTTSICGTFASALVAARLLALDREAVVEALGIAGSFTSGLLECLRVSTSAKRLHAGWAGLGGIVAAELARASYTGPRTVFEGEFGLYPAFLPSEPLDLGAVVRDLGRRWEILDIRPKRYPCCHYLQAFVDATLRLRQEHGVGAADVSRIDCGVARGAVNIVCEPWAKKLAPATGYDTRFSLPFAVSLALARGRAGVAEFSEASLGDRTIGELMARVRYEVDESFQVKDMPARVTVTLRGGQRIEQRVDRVRGDAGRPIPRAELVEKFHENAAGLDDDARRWIADRLLAFEEMSRLEEVMDALSRPATVAAR